MVQHYKFHFVWISFSAIFSGSAFADTQTDELLKMLTTPIAEYKVDTQPYVIDPKIAKRQYEVTWRVQPSFRVNAEDYQSYRQPIKVEMIVEAGSGQILQSKTIRSSGSVRVDQKVHDALQQAKLQPLPMVERTLRYSLVHEFNIAPPL
ncbi:hypothetical protein C9E88_014095 [Acinetobacter cumulans]|uniref:TonB C-terminal domain-containing protein n=1 Tax=Acinetobacter TaxID=469 RepID=UPI000D11D093|nr:MULTISPECIES: TonB C-terminal domain-containing protein [Acinetobacter]QCO22541.1 hypothetical protein C9E88_014095 [Acinetobacter cumulans]RKG40163.1 hypothetical protein D7V51_15335 [Acinetobacter cumulans]RZG56647.1 hypothetical protein EXE29_15185 [Acinetobacter sp. WCHAc060006]